MLAGRQQDALECFKLFYTALGRVSNIDAEFCDVPLQYPSGLPQGAHYTIAQLLNLIATEKGIIGASAPPALVLSVLPYRLLTEFTAAWVKLQVSEWDAAVDLAPFFRSSEPSPQYAVKAMVYHSILLKVLLTWIQVTTLRT